MVAADRFDDLLFGNQNQVGRVWRVSNPYLAANRTGAINPPGLWTTTTYDELNRVLTVTTPDGAKAITPPDR